jgi:hypothetical protein
MKISTQLEQENFGKSHSGRLTCRNARGTVLKGKKQCGYKSVGL